MAFLHSILRSSSRDIPNSLKTMKYFLNFNSQYIENKTGCHIYNCKRSFHNGSRLLKKEMVESSEKKSISEATGEVKFSDLSTGEKVKRVGNDITYTSIVIGGICITAVIFYSIGKELLSGDSVQGVYAKASKTLKHNYEIIDTFGEPLKVYGELSKRGRRKHIKHTEYEHDGCHYIRMKFYIEGPHRKGTVHCEMKKEIGGHYEYRYLFVELDGNQRTIIIEDNRI